MKNLRLATVVAVSALVVGCGGSSDDTGTMSLRLTDAPIDGAQEVVVQFSAVEIRGDDSDQNRDFTFDPPLSIDVLALQGDATADFFTNETVPAGVYKEIRLVVDAVEGTQDTYIVLDDGSEHDMTVPSGSTSGLKIKGGFTVPVNGAANFTIDFDVRKSIVAAGNANSGIDYHLKPVLRIVDDTEVGMIEGTVEVGLLSLAAGCSDDDVDSNNAVYVFEGSGVTADDIDGDAVEPVVTALVNYDAVDEAYEYTAAFLVAGDYTVAFTCNADAEDIDTDNDLHFVDELDVTVTADGTITANFIAPVI